MRVESFICDRCGITSMGVDHQRWCHLFMSNEIEGDLCPECSPALVNYVIKYCREGQKPIGDTISMPELRGGKDEKD